ncbi:hypothetical protein [Scytonema millei]|uniref:Uncharacterized protein n=1 Tax=Tolypothrix bouteillei VB521301 TaxID=1479485 RepID=A0A0C1N5N7_9CYAN
MKKKLLIYSAISLSLFVPTIAFGEESQFDRWTTLGKTNTGETLVLNDTSVKIVEILVDESLNNEDGFYDNLPKTKVVQFDYSIGGRKRHAYTKSCKNGAVVGNAHWKTYTTFVDYNPQYFLVEADSEASKKMIKRVCSLSAYKTN